MTGAVLGSRSDAGWVTSTSIQQSAAIAISLINARAASKISNRQFDMAERNWRIARELHDYWQTKYKPFEIITLDEAKNKPIREPQYEEQAGRFAISVRSQFAQAYIRVQTCTSKFCSGAKAIALRDLAIAEATATGDAINYAYRYEEAYTDSRNDVRWSRIQTMLGLGRNLFTPSIAHAQAAGNQYSSLGQQAGSSAKSAMEALGYVFNRNKTDVPTYKPQARVLNEDQSMPALNKPMGSIRDVGPMELKKASMLFDNQGFQQGGSFDKHSLLKDTTFQNNDYASDYGSGVSGDK